MIPTINTPLATDAVSFPFDLLDHLLSCAIRLQVPLDLSKSSSQTTFSFIRSCLDTAPNPGPGLVRAALRGLNTASATEASLRGRTDILAIRARIAPKTLVLERKTMVDVSGRGHTHVLSWWLEWLGGPRELARFANTDVVINAACFGHVSVLEFWRQTGLIKDGWWKWVVIEACRRGKVDVLRWWAGTPELQDLEYSEASVDYASGNGHVDVLNWWLHESGGREIKYSEQAMRSASIEGHVAVLQWWLASGLDLKYHEDAVDMASGYGQVQVLGWWKASGLPIKYSAAAMDAASRNGHANVLEWWMNTATMHPNLPLLYTLGALTGPYYNDLDHPVRKWWDHNRILSETLQESTAPVVIARPIQS